MSSNIRFIPSIFSLRELTFSYVILSPRYLFIINPWREKDRERILNATTLAAHFAEGDRSC